MGESSAYHTCGYMIVQTRSYYPPPVTVGFGCAPTIHVIVSSRFDASSMMRAVVTHIVIIFTSHLGLDRHGRFSNTRRCEHILNLRGGVRLWRQTEEEGAKGRGGWGQEWKAPSSCPMDADFFYASKFVPITVAACGPNGYQSGSLSSEIPGPNSVVCVDVCLCSPRAGRASGGGGPAASSDV